MWLRTHSLSICLGYLFRRTYTKDAELVTHPDSRLGQVGPHRDLLPRAHVRISVPGEGGFQLLQLLGGEVRPLPPLPLVVLVVLLVL